MVVFTQEERMNRASYVAGIVVIELLGFGLQTLSAQPTLILSTAPLNQSTMLVPLTAVDNLGGPENTPPSTPTGSSPSLLRASLRITPSLIRPIKGGVSTYLYNAAVASGTGFVPSKRA
jgi:hypothetical protein